MSRSVEKGTYTNSFRVERREDGKPQAFLFPGQGIQESGMGEALYKAYPSVRTIFKNASRILGQSVEELCFRASQEELNKTENAQIAIFTVNHACYTLWRQRGEKDPDFFAGNSLGQINALVAAGAISFEEGLRLVAVRGRAMQNACEENPGKLYAASIKDSEQGPEQDHKRQLEEIRNACGDHGLFLEAVNSPTQLVIGWRNEDSDSMRKFLSQFPTVRITELNVSGVFHSQLMMPAYDEFAKAVDEIKVKIPRRPVIDNTTIELLRDEQQIKEALKRHLTHPVLWEDTIHFLRGQGVDTTLELGSKGLLSSMQKNKGVIAAVALAGLGAAGIIAHKLIFKKKED